MMIPFVSDYFFLAIFNLMKLSFAESSISNSATLSSTTSRSDSYLIGPLTTIFIPPIRCVINTEITAGDLTSLPNQSLFYNGPSGATGVRAECYPTGYPHNESFNYSPGVCPDRWTLNTTSVVQMLFATSSSSGETVGICCPPEYTYRTDGPFGCASYLPDPTSAIRLNFSYMDLYDPASRTKLGMSSF
jgi:hypothetical protein